MSKCFTLLTIAFCFSCSPKGPQTFDNYMVGKTKEELLKERGEPSEIRVYEKSEALIYKKKSEYFGSSDPSKQRKKKIKPKKVILIERIYYSNAQGKIYKYQVWRKKIK